MNERRDGFTVVELLIAMSVFVIAVSIATGAFVRSLRTQRMLNELMSVQSNASLMIEQMAREARSGFSFRTDGTDPRCQLGTSRPTLTFVRVRGAATTTVAYTWNIAAKTIERTEGVALSTVLNASNVSIERFCFIADQVARDPWRITMVATVGSTKPQLAGSGVKMQTTVSARTLPCDLEAGGC